MPKIMFVLLSMLILFSRNAVAEAPYRYLSAQTLNIEGKVRKTKTWTANEKQQVDRYFQKLDSIAPDLMRLIKKGKDLGPVYVLRVGKTKRSVGLSKQQKRGEKTYLILSDTFFRAYDSTSKDIGYDGGNYTLWFFVHELVHLAEFRSVSDVNAPLPTFDPNNIIFRVLNPRFGVAKVMLGKQKIDPKKYVLGNDNSRVDIVHDLGLPTKYCLWSFQEALAEILTALILSPAYKPPSDIQQAVDEFYKR